MIAAFELAVLEALRDAGGVRFAYRYATLETYPEDWTEWLKDKPGLIRAPAAWIGFRGWDIASNENHLPTVRAQFWLVVMAENARNEQARRHGDPADAVAAPGSYQLLVDAASILSGQSFDLAIGGIALGAARQVARPDALKEKKVSMLALELSAVLRIPERLATGDVGDFEIFHANWDVPEFGNVAGAPGSAQADATDDATDHVELEIAP